MHVFPFVVGCGRSGTTLVRAILDSHPDLAIPPEFPFLNLLYRAHYRHERDGRLDVDLFVKHMWRFRDPVDHQRPSIETRWGLEFEDVTKVFDHAQPKSFVDAARLMYSVYADKRGKPRYGEKVPQYVVHIAKFAALFPESRFIHVIRDGRNVALSAMEVDWAPHKIGDAALWWKNRVEAGRAAGRRLGGPRYLEVRLEDLVADPEAVTRRMCEFVDLAYDPEMLEYHNRAEEITKNLGSPHRGISEPPTNRFRDWRQQLDADDVALFEHLAGDLLNDLGYDVSGRRGDPILALRSVASRARRNLSELKMRAGARRSAGRFKS